MIQDNIGASFYSIFSGKIKDLVVQRVLNRIRTIKHKENKMRTPILAIAILLIGLNMTSCSGGGSGPGYLFQLIFIVAPLIGLGLLLLKRSESANDSLYILEGQIKRLSSKIDSIEEKLADSTPKTTKKTTKK